MKCAEFLRCVYRLVCVDLEHVIVNALIQSRGNRSLRRRRSRRSRSAIVAAIGIGTRTRPLRIVVVAVVVAVVVVTDTEAVVALVGCDCSVDNEVVVVVVDGELVGLMRAHINIISGSSGRHRVSAIVSDVVVEVDGGGEDVVLCLRSSLGRKGEDRWGYSGDSINDSSRFGNSGLCCGSSDGLSCGGLGDSGLACHRLNRSRLGGDGSNNRLSSSSSCGL